jgi:ribulose-phosphate 3-epimerase
MKPIISPSLLAADFGNLQCDVEMLNRSSADWFHLDVMDGVFVPNISFGFPVMQAIAAYAQKPLDVHLMIEKPEKFIDQVRNLGARYMNVHVEACPHLHRVVQQIHDAGMLAGATLNPSTPVEMLEDVLCDLDLALVMSVNPGFGGQKFIEHSLVKVEKLRRMADLCGSSAIIEVDGGVNLDNAPMLLEAGADALVAGSAIFNAPDPEAEIDAFKALE